MPLAFVVVLVIVIFAVVVGWALHWPVAPTALASGSVTVTGSLSYKAPPNETTTQPVQYAYVRLERQDNGQLLGWIYTTSSGAYTIGPVSNPHVPLLLSVWACTRYNVFYQLIDPYSPTGYFLLVEPIGGAGAPLSSYSRTFSLGTLPDGTFTFNNTFGPEDAADPAQSNLPAWWIRPELDKAIKATSPVGSLRTEWRHDFIGSRFCYDAPIVCGPENVIRYDKDAPKFSDELQHEIGHSIMYSAWDGQMAAEALKYWV